MKDMAKSAGGVLSKRSLAGAAQLGSAFSAIAVESIWRYGWSSPRPKSSRGIATAFAEGGIKRGLLWPKASGVSLIKIG